MGRNTLTVLKITTDYSEKSTPTKDPHTILVFTAATWESAHPIGILFADGFSW